MSNGLHPAPNNLDLFVVFGTPYRANTTAKRPRAGSYGDPTAAAALCDKSTEDHSDNAGEVGSQCYVCADRLLVQSKRK